MSALIKQNRVLFLHIPRTGGTWVKKAINLLEIPVTNYNVRFQIYIAKKHGLLAHIRRPFRARIDSTFCFVRHPITFYESVWKYIITTDYNGKRYIKLSNKWRWHPLTKAVEQYKQLANDKRNKEIDFNDWVTLMLCNEPMWCTRLMEQYIGPEGGEFCKFIGRTETLSNDFVEALNFFRIKTNVDLSVLNTLKKQNTREGVIRWDEDVKSFVLDTERLFIRRFYDSNKDKRIYV